jgi:hypothetical protein
MIGYYGTRGGQPPPTIAIAKPELGGSIPAPPHSATSLSNHDNNQLGGECIPVYLDKYLIFLLLFLVCFKKG